MREWLWSLAKNEDSRTRLSYGTSLDGSTAICALLKIQKWLSDEYIRKTSRKWLSVKNGCEYFLSVSYCENDLSTDQVMYFIKVWNPHQPNSTNMAKCVKMGETWLTGHPPSITLIICSFECNSMLREGKFPQSMKIHNCHKISLSVGNCAKCG